MESHVVYNILVGTRDVRTQFVRVQFACVMLVRVQLARARLMFLLGFGCTYESVGARFLPPKK
jgi:hypothetical protein